MFDIRKDIQEIGRMLTSAAMLEAVRREVAASAKDGFVVTDGAHRDSGYDVVVKCGKESTRSVARRIRNGVTDVRVERLAAGVLGVRKARRVKMLKETVDGK